MNACEYSIVMYILNTAMSGMDNLITTEDELSSIISHPTRAVRQAIEELSGRNIIKSRYGDGTQSPNVQSLSLALLWDLSKWKLGLKEIPTASALAKIKGESFLPQVSPRFYYHFHRFCPSKNQR